MEDSETSSKNENKWAIDYDKEKKLWTEIIIPKYSHQPHTCPTSHSGECVLKESTGYDILNPYYLRCNNKPCKKRKNLRVYTFFALHKNIPASIILEIFKLFIIIRLNGKQIFDKLSLTFQKNISYDTVLNILVNIRHCIADYLKHEYRYHQIGEAFPSKKLYQ